MTVLVLSDSEAAYLKDIIDWWLEDHDEANSDVEQDKTFDSAEEMLQSVASMKMQQSTAQTIRARISLALVGKET